MIVIGIVRCFHELGAIIFGAVVLELEFAARRPRCGGAALALLVLGVELVAVLFATDYPLKFILLALCCLKFLPLYEPLPSRDFLNGKYMPALQPPL